jgi:hypothetical protein
MQGKTGRLAPDDEQSPLVSARFLTVATLSVLLLAAASIAISWFGRSYGERLSLAGHSENSAIVDITIGRDQLSLPQNVIRFEQQRQSGPAERIDLYLLWPELTGYSTSQRRRFDDVSLSNSLIFLQISQSTMSRDMSGRVEPIYRHLLSPGSQPDNNGLVVHSFQDATGYEGEKLLIGKLPDGSAYAVRCVMPQSSADATASDCQRDIHVGEDLTVLYRFSSQLIPDWAEIDQSVRQYIESRAHASPPAATLKNQIKGSTDHSS